MYYTYMLRCVDNSLYTGITTDLERRMEEHFSKSDKCAKYTFRHSAKKLEAAWRSEDRMLASKLEYNIKKLTKDKKEELLIDNSKMEKYLSKKIDCKLYERIKLSMKDEFFQKGR